MKCKHCGHPIAANTDTYERQDGTFKPYSPWIHVNPPDGVGRIYCSYAATSTKAAPASIPVFDGPAPA